MKAAEQPKLTTEERAKAEQLMSTYAQLTENKEALLKTIENEIKAYDENMKSAEKELLAIGALHKDEFDGNGNLELGKGYLHIGNKTIIIIKRKFDLKVFGKKFPDMIDITKMFKVAPIKKAFLDSDLRKEISKLGLSVGTEKDKMEVLIHEEKS